MKDEAREQALELRRVRWRAEAVHRKLATAMEPARKMYSASKKITTKNY